MRSNSALNLVRPQERRTFQDISSEPFYTLPNPFNTLPVLLIPYPYPSKKLESILFSGKRCSKEAIWWHCIIFVKAFSNKFLIFIIFYFILFIFFSAYVYTNCKIVDSINWRRATSWNLLNKPSSSSSSSSLSSSSSSSSSSSPSSSSLLLLLLLLNESQLHFYLNI